MMGVISYEMESRFFTGHLVSLPVLLNSCYILIAFGFRTFCTLVVFVSGCFEN